MTIKELRNLIKGLPDDTEIRVIGEEGHDLPVVLGGRQLTITDKSTTVKVWLEV